VACVSIASAKNFLAVMSATLATSKNQRLVIDKELCLGLHTY